MNNSLIQDEIGYYQTLRVTIHNEIGYYHTLGLPHSRRDRLLSVLFKPLSASVFLRAVLTSMTDTIFRSTYHHAIHGSPPLVIVAYSQGQYGQMESINVLNVPEDIMGAATSARDLWMVGRMIG